MDPSISRNWPGDNFERAGLEISGHEVIAKTSFRGTLPAVFRFLRPPGGFLGQWVSSGLIAEAFWCCLGSDRIGRATPYIMSYTSTDYTTGAFSLKIEYVTGMGTLHRQ